MVTDIQCARFIKDGKEIGKGLVDEARELMESGDPVEAAPRIALAWSVLNSAAMLAADGGMHTQKAKIEGVRLKVRMISGELMAMGIAPTSFAFDGQLAFRVEPKEGEDE